VADDWIPTEQQEAWQALANRATLAPWRVGCEGSEGSRVNRDSGDRRLDSRALLIVNGAEQPQEHFDAEFIAAARTAVPALLAALRAAEDRIDALRDQVGIEVRARQEWESNAEQAEATIARVRDALLPHDEGHADRLAMDPADCGPLIIDDIRRALAGTETEETP